MYLSSNSRPAYASILFVIATLSFLLWVMVAHVAGQSDINPWTTPFNLSKSGSAAEPQIVTDNAGTVHVLWQDSVAGTFAHAHNNVASDATTEASSEGSSDGEDAGGEAVAAAEINSWSEPVLVELPFGTRRYFPDLSDNEPTPLFIPRMVADSEGSIHAIWIDDSANAGDIESGSLYHSRVPSGEFDTYGSWTARTSIATETLKAVIVNGSEDVLHVVYMQIADVGTGEEMRPAGLYYRRSDDGGSNWSTPVTLAESAYFRLLTPETANVQLALDNQSIYVAWDDWPHGRVFTIRSIDGGQTWDEPNALDRREENDGTDVTGPNKVRLFAANGVVQVTWQAGHEGLDCGQFYRWSSDGGNIWESRQRILETLSGCSAEVEFIKSSETSFLLTTTPSNRFLTAWNRSNWGLPQEQSSLNSYVNPETFQLVNFTCGLVTTSQGDELWVAACGAGASQDIWLQNRSLADLVGPPVDSVWEPPVVVSEADTQIASPVLIADATNRLHAFWTQPISEAEVPFGPQTTAIQYSQWDQGRWSRPEGVLKSPVGKSDQPAAVEDGAGRLLAVWSGGNFGEIFFSLAATANAPLPSEWITPKQLSANETAASDPAIAVDAEGTIYVVYTIPSGDGRGIYLTKSLDNGDTWSEPSLVFDAVAAGWEMVAEPRLAVMGSGQLYMLWLNRPLPSSIGVDSLYYANSTDGGSIWSEAQLISSDTQAVAPILWHEIISSAGGILHHVWQEWSNERLIIWHRQSIDGGGTWTEADIVNTLSTINVPTTLTADEAGQLHLLYVDQGSGTFSIRHWVWQDGSWNEAESLRPDRRSVSRINALQAVALGDQLTTLFSGPVGDTSVVADANVVGRLFFSQSEMELPDFTPTPLPPTTATPEPVVAEATTTPEPTPTPTVVFPVGVQPQGGQLIPGIPSQFNGIAIGFAAVAVLMGVFFLVIIGRHIWQDRTGR